jgi:iron-sulfur cluster assembly accessory protein
MRHCEPSKETTMKQIDVTPLALDNIRELREEYGEANWGLRFGLSGGGCSGYKYVLEFEDAATEGDLIFEFGDVKIFVNQEHMDKLKNSTIDWTDSIMESGFSIENPQAKRPCGCGASVDF